MAYAEDGSVKPLLAESIDVSSDKLRYTFHLRRNIKFHNGKPMTSADALWSWQRYMDVKTGWRCTANFDGRISIKVDKVEAADDFTVVMTLAEPNGLFLANLARTDCGNAAILHRDSVDASGNFVRPVGTGPFKLAEWKKGEYLLFQRFPVYVSPPGAKPDGYVGAKQALADYVKLVIVPDPAAIKAGLTSGAIDAAQIQPSDIEDLAKNDRIHIDKALVGSRTILMFQTLDPALSDIRLRRALTLALDQRELVEAASEGLGVLANSSVFSRSRYFSEAQKANYPYDPVAAKKLAEEAGYRGETLIMNATRSGNSYKVGVVAQAMWQAAGFNIKLEMLEPAAQLDRYNSGKYQILSQTASAQFDPSLAYDQFIGPKATQPRKQWDSPAALSLLRQSGATENPAERQAIFDKMHAMQLAEIPMVILYNSTDVNARTTRVQGAFFWQTMVQLWQCRIVQ